MMCYPPSHVIIIHFKEVKIIWGQGLDISSVPANSKSSSFIKISGAKNALGGGDHTTCSIL